ncbi:DNA repair protein RadC [Candidatus Saccharibacteria bacterium]|nr:DNA repair protein RadC [Candidatus Saccharibacteria bacterium]
MKMTDRLITDRPREKMQKYGAGKLSDLELLMAIIGSGSGAADVTKIARNLKKLIAEKGSELTVDDLMGVKGMALAKTTQFMAAFELWRRQFEVTERPIIDTPEKAVAQLADIRDKKQEYFVCLTLDGANRLIAKRIITIGTLTASLVHPREVFADAITDRAASIIVAHNHPSGSLKPSDADNEVTNRIQEAGELLGILLNDHLIVTQNDYVSIL